MCKNGETKLINHTNGDRLGKSIDTMGRTSPEFVSFTSTIILLVLSVYGTLQFSLSFPFVLWKKGATEYYVRASYEYDEINTRFDNTIWTYGTDYALAAIMFFGTIHCMTCVEGYSNLRLLSSGLLLSYCVQVLFGGFAHQNYLTLESLNTKSFKTVWIICVGTVALAGGFIGAIGTELGKALHGMGCRMRIPLLPHYFWILWGLYLMLYCAMGGISFKRPACDIFIAGTTQTFPTVYTVAIVLSHYWEKSPNTKNQKLTVFVSKLQSLVSSKHRNFFYLGFFLNAPLLPLYPVLLSSNLQLGSVNAICHTNLLTAWGLQYITLWRFCVALQMSSNNNLPKEH